MTFIEMRAQLEALECRVSALESARKPAPVTMGSGFNCACCNTKQPVDHYVYYAVHVEGEDRKTPICGKCAQQSLMGDKFKIEGPFPQ